MGFNKHTRNGHIKHLCSEQQSVYHLLLSHAGFEPTTLFAVESGVAWLKPIGQPCRDCTIIWRSKQI